jgi:predicted DNA-binding protein
MKVSERQFSFRLPGATDERLTLLAEAYRRKRGDMLRLLIEDAALPGEVRHLHSAKRSARPAAQPGTRR